MNSLFNNFSLLTASAQESYVIAFDASLVIEVILHIVAVLVLFLIISKLLFKPVRGVLAKRKEKIATDLSVAKSNKENALMLKEEYDKKLADIKDEANEILRQAHEKAKLNEKNIINEAKVEADRIIARANVDIEREQQKAREEMKKDIIQVATLMATKFVAAAIDANKQDELVEQTINEMGDKVWLR